jgi:hypothetical protein
MSGPLAIAAVTAVLKDVLNNGFVDHDLSVVGSFLVTAVPPDRITTGATEPNQLNLFLYQVTPNQGWRNADLPSRDSNGERVTNPPLALDLHYLLTAYGSQDFNAEILLGYAMQILHEMPVLSRKDIRTTLGSPLPGGTVIPPLLFGNLSALDLAEQVEQIKITPHYLTTEELSKLWTAMQARYRQSMAYQVSVVLIQSTKPAKAALPVIKRGEQDRGAEVLADASSTFPSLDSIHIGPPEDANLEPLPRSYPSAQLGLQLILQGQNLDGDTVQVTFKHTRYGEVTHPQHLAPQIIVVPLVQRTETKITISLPDAPAAWRVGLYSVAVTVTKGTKDHSTNELPLVLAPRIDPIIPNSITRVGLDATLTLTCSPQVIQEQTAALLLPDREVTLPNHPTGTTLVFVINNAPVVTDVPVRIRIDGIDSMPFGRKFDVNGNPLPLAFVDNQKVSIS